MLDRLTLPGTGDRQTNGDPAFTKLLELGEHSRVVEDAALERGRVDLIKPQVRTEQSQALRQLAAQRREREILLLVHPRIDAPAGRVRVAPLRRDRDFCGCQASLPQPGSQEALRPSVRARGVEVAHPAGIGSVEHGVRIAFHRLHIGSPSKVLAVTERDVAGAAKRRETQTDSTNYETGSAESRMHPPKVATTQRLRSPGDPLSKRRCILIGDAAGLIDPLSGEEIHSAFLSAKPGPEAVATLLHGKAPDRAYPKATLATLGGVPAACWGGKAAFDRFPRASYGLLHTPQAWRAMRHILQGRAGGKEEHLLTASMLAKLAGDPGRRYLQELAH